MKLLLFIGLLLSNPLLVKEVDKCIPPNEIKGKHILEVGAKDVNGSVRWIFEGKGCASYLGTDIDSGKSVDYIANVYELDQHFSKRKFDIVICLETLEHIEYWREAVIQMERVLKKGGLMIVSTPKPGFKYHGWPYDYWRYTLDDWRKILIDFEEVYAVDWRPSGCLYVARKLRNGITVDLSDIELYAVEKPDNKN